MRCKNETKIQINDDAIFRYQGTNKDAIVMFRLGFL